MELNRRELLALATVAGTGAVSSSVMASQTGNGIALGDAAGKGHREALERIRAFAAAELAQKGFPGMSLALVGPDGFSAVLPVGLANVDRAIPMATDHLFQVGSISKSMVALTLFALAHRRKVDLDSTVQSLLPDHPLPPEPIPLIRLLDHSSGLPNGAPAFPPVPGGSLWTGWQPGTRYSYSNLGYDLVGAVVERASGMSCAKAVESLVLQPLGMGGAESVIRISNRSRYATGYVRARDDLPWRPGATLAPAQWIDFDFPSGSVAATPGDMAKYLGFLLQAVRGRGAPLFSDALAQRFRTPTVDAPTYGGGARYANGLITLDIEGRRMVRHTGGTLAFSSAFVLDPEAGVGCYAGVNVGGAGGYRPIEVAEHACSLLAAAAKGHALPAERQPKSPPATADAGRFTGRWESAGVPHLLVEERDGTLFMTYRGRQRPLWRSGANLFAVDEPSLPEPNLRFAPDQALLRIGDRLYSRDKALPLRPAAARLARLASLYYNPASLNPRIRVFAVEDALFVGSATLAEAADGSWRPSDPAGANERLWFEHFVDGRPQQLNASGNLYKRVHDGSL